VEVQQARDVDVFRDVDGLLSLIDLCDVVLTIDNVTAHLAGSIGKKSVVLVPAGKGRYWYWGGEEQSLWYPSLRLVYQENVGDWAPGIASAAGLLQQIS
jgi:ADP-heptose:LPS heptosyltransferase